MHHDEKLHDHEDFRQGQKARRRLGGKGGDHFPEEKVVMSIYDGTAHHESWCKLKLSSQAVNVVSPTSPEYLRWSESPITFDRTDHPYSIPKPGRFPLIVDLLVGMTQLTKALMDGGSGLKLMYLDTFEGLGLTQDQLQSSPHPFRRAILGKQSTPSGGSPCWSPSKIQATTAPKHSRSRSSTSPGHITSS
jgi:hypothetical protein